MNDNAQAAAFARQRHLHPVTDLHERGLDRDVTVVVWGEYGRTPKINRNAGRDHWPQATFAGKLEAPADLSQTKVTREVDAGLEVIDVELPAVITTDLRLNEPRYVKLPDIMKAKKKPLESLSLDELGVDATPGIQVENYEPPAQRSKGVMVDSVDALVGALRDKGLLG